MISNFNITKEITWYVPSEGHVGNTYEELFAKKNEPKFDGL